jgi:hypothetical protein
MKISKFFLLVFLYTFSACKRDKAALTESGVFTDNNDTVRVEKTIEVSDNTQKEVGITENFESQPNTVKNQTKINSPKPEKPAVKTEQTESLPDDRMNPKTENPKPEPDIKKVSSDINVYQQLLTKYVDMNGRVNYNGLKKDIDLLEKYTNSLSDDQIFEPGNKKEKLALWINT